MEACSVRDSKSLNRRKLSTFRIVAIKWSFTFKTDYKRLSFGVRFETTNEYFTALAVTNVQMLYLSSSVICSLINCDLSVQLRHTLPVTREKLNHSNGIHQNFIQAKMFSLDKNSANFQGSFVSKTIFPWGLLMDGCREKSCANSLPDFNSKGLVNKIDWRKLSWAEVELR